MFIVIINKHEAKLLWVAAISKMYKNGSITPPMIGKSY